MQQGVQTDATCDVNNVESCWPTVFRPFAWGFMRYVACVAGVKRGRGRGNLGAREMSPAFGLMLKRWHLSYSMDFISK